MMRESYKERFNAGELVMRLTLGLVAVLVVVAAGCEDKNIGHIQGKVTINGQPLTHGSVVFEDKAADISIYATLSPEGTYKIRTHDKGGLPAGTYQVAVTPLGPFSGTPAMTNMANNKGGAVQQQIPEKYQKAATSGLTAMVQPGDNPPFDFELVQ